MNAGKLNTLKLTGDISFLIDIAKMKDPKNAVNAYSNRTHMAVAK
jgi:hypothetical protein